MTIKKIIVRDTKRVFNAISFGVFFAGCAFNEGNHAIEEAVPWLRGDLNLEPVGNHGGPTGDGAKVAAVFTYYWRRFTGDGGFIH